MSAPREPAMCVGVAAARCWIASGPHTTDGVDRVPTFCDAPEPERPGRFSPGTWRKMSRLARLVAGAAEPLASSPDDALIVGVSGGEFASSVAFLRSYYLRGAALASPLAFQNSVHNAPAAHLSIDLGLRGWSETILAGEGTFWRTVERAMTRVIVARTPVIVVIAEDLSAEVRDGISAAGEGGHWVEAAAALRMVPEGGTRLAWHDGAAEDGAVLARPRGVGFDAANLAAMVHKGRGAYHSPKHQSQPAWLEVG